jgi:hypothetical protein
VIALSKQIRLWKITGKGFNELERDSVEQEKKLHDWLEGDISLIFQMIYWLLGEKSQRLSISISTFYALTEMAIQ